MPAEEGRVLGQRGIRSTGELFRMLARSLALARLVTDPGADVTSAAEAWWL